MNLKPGRVPVVYHPAVSHETHKLLMSHIDSVIEATTDAKKWEALSQEKVIFCLLRYVGFSAQRVAMLLPLHLSALSYDEDGHDNFDVPTSRNGALRMLQDFVTNRCARPTLSPQHQNIFVSPYTGRAMSESTIQLRFQRAVESACLTKAIPNLMAYKRHST